MLSSLPSPLYHVTGAEGWGGRLDGGVREVGQLDGCPGEGQ